MKKLSIILILLATAILAKAQGNQAGNASQGVSLGLGNALEISFTDNNSSAGQTVNMNFGTMTAYTNGAESGDIELKVQSNKNFNVTVKASSNKFTYSGSATNGNTNMQVSNVLALKVAANNTGGTVGSSFSATSYQNLNQNSKTLLQNCIYGGNQSFAVKYKAETGFNYPSGIYTIDIIYTATQQ